MGMLLLPWVISGLSIILLILSVIKRKDTTPADYARLFELSDRFTRVEASVEQMQFATNSLNSFKELFAIPKVRGEMGQFSCEEILSNIFPNSHFIKKQHSFSDGHTVDFLLSLNDMQIPIDSKFILFNEKNIGPKIKECISRVKQYIKPNEGTTDYALLFLPSDGIYTRIINYEKEDLLSLAIQSNVLITCPNLLYAQLFALRSGYKGLQIADKAKLVIANLSTIKIEIAQLLGILKTVEGHHRKGAKKLTEALLQCKAIENQIDDAAKD